MTNVVKFPANKIVRDITQSSEEIEKSKERGRQKFAEDIMEDFIMTLHDALESYGIDTEGDIFDGDFSITIEMLRAAIYRTLNLKHPLHEFIDKHVQVVDTETKIVEIEDKDNVEDIILGKIPADAKTVHIDINE